MRTFIIIYSPDAQIPVALVGPYPRGAPRFVDKLWVLMAEVSIRQTERVRLREVDTQPPTTSGHLPLCWRSGQRSRPAISLPSLGQGATLGSLSLWC